jgi:hypothetical protein
MPAKKPIVNYQEEWKEQKLNITNLVLDTKNIRLGTVHSTQDEIINDLFINEDAMVILENIVKNGYFPDEPPVAIKEGAKYVVLEGNRRVVSLKAMISPSIAPPKYVSKIEKIMAGRLPLESIKVHLAPSRDAAMEYLAAKHTKTTRKPWSALRRAYFYYAQKEQGMSIEKLIERYDGVNIPEYIRMYEMHQVASSLKHLSEDVRKKVSNTGKFNISTLERFYSDKNVQSEIGISFDKKTGEAKVPASDDFDKVFSRVVTDIETGIATSRKELSGEKERKGYIASVVKEVLAGKKIDLGTAKSASTFKPPAKKTKKETLFPGELEDTFGTPGISRRLWELQYIDFRKFSNATADMLRTFLEIVLKDYLSKIGKTPAPKRGKFIYLDDVLDATRAELQAASNNRLVQVIDTITTTKWYLESINHNPDVFADGDRVKDVADQMYPLVKHVFDDYEKRKKKSTK